MHTQGPQPAPYPTGVPSRTRVSIEFQGAAEAVHSMLGVTVFGR